MRNNQFCKGVLVLVLLMISSFILHAQVNSRDVVYLKNGSVIKGIIVEIVPGATIKIKTADGSIFIYPMDDVLRTEKEESAGQDGKQSKQKLGGSDDDIKSEYNYAGYFMMFRVGPRMNNLINNSIDLNVGFINGIQLNEVISIGVGIETTQYYFSADQASSIRMTPVFLDTRFYIPKKRVRPMFSFQFGYAQGGETKASTHQNNNWNDFYPKTKSGGIFMALGAGMRIHANQTVSFLFDGGISLQTFDGYSDTSMSTIKNRTVASLRLNFGLGINIGGSKPK